MNEHATDSHWLTSPKAIRRLWIAFAVVLTVTVELEIWVSIEGKFTLDGGFGFGAWYGFLSCVAMVLVARALGWWLKRSEGYYADGAEEETGDA